MRKSRYINEKTAYFYALHEWDDNTYIRRQNLLKSLHLSPKKEQKYEKMFGFFSKQSSKIMLDNQTTHDPAFWIYAYAKQSTRFHQKRQEFIYFQCQLYEERFLIHLFLQCYPVLEL